MQVVPIVDGKRRCSRCKTAKLVKDFNSYVRNGKKVYTWCKECQRVCARGRYRLHGPRKLIQLKRVAVNELKKKPCTDCRQSFHPVAMDFDHVVGKKRAGIAQMVDQTYSMETMLEEIAKCELVCANCHRVRTWLRSQNGGVSSSQSMST